MQFDFSSYVPLLFCLVLAAATAYLVIAWSRRAGRGGGQVEEQFEQEPPPAGADKASDKESQSNGKDPKADADRKYQDRLFVIKMFDSLGMKPTPEQLDGLAALGDRVVIMQRMIDLQKKKTEADGAPAAPPPKPPAVDSKDVPGADADAAPADGGEPFVDADEPGPPPPPEQDRRGDYRGYALVEDEVAAEHPARRHVRDMYAILERLEADL